VAGCGYRCVQIGRESEDGLQREPTLVRGSGKPNPSRRNGPKKRADDSSFWILGRSLSWNQGQKVLGMVNPFFGCSDGRESEDGLQREPTLVRGSGKPNPCRRNGPKKRADDSSFWILGRSLSWNQGQKVLGMVNPFFGCSDGRESGRFATGAHTGQREW
jgi:hypothetical protein